LSIPGHLLLALAAVVVVGRLFGRILARFGQPPVMGDIVAGIALGPSVLGVIAPVATFYVLPPPVAPYLGVVAQLGVIIYMFLVGLELNPAVIRGQMRATVTTALASIAVPFALGAALAVYLYPRLSSAAVPFVHFSLFMGIALSITAFPVLARILEDRGMAGTRLGTAALTCAAIADVVTWCVLAFVVGVVQARVESFFLVAGFTLGFVAVMFFLVRPLFRRLSVPSDARSARDVVALALAAMLLSALATETIGVHAVFGAFLLGAVIPHDGELARSLERSLGDLATVLLLPAFFALTGMRTEVGLLSGTTQWGICALIVVAATVGKFGGTFAAARATGMDARHAAGLGVLMNTRGLMELIVLNIGLDLGVISPTLFTMLVVMALVTTLATTPILRRLGSIGSWRYPAFTGQPSP
jgi:Kef-type K+ transport system membrane component KefB